MTAIMELMDVINAFVWGPPMMIILVGTGIFLTIRLGGIQFRKSGVCVNSLGVVFFGEKISSGFG
ncbi:hypothetical protein KJ830_03555 [bacterium]|nr:hypothetical protein [bacterium]